MADYECCTRTNYFHVKDPSAFKEFMNRVYGDSSPVQLWEERDKSGTPVFAFGSYGGISGIKDIYGSDDEVCDDEYIYDDDSDYDAFISGLQKHIAENDAVIIIQAGNEKLRYVCGSAVIVTANETDYLDITSLAVNTAQEMLKEPKWSTKTDY